MNQLGSDSSENEIDQTQMMKQLLMKQDSFLSKPPQSEEETKGRPEPRKKTEKPKKPTKKGKFEHSRIIESDSNESDESPPMMQESPKKEWSDVEEPPSMLESSGIMPKKRNMSMEEYMHELVGKQFYDFV